MLSNRLHIIQHYHWIGTHQCKVLNQFWTGHCGLSRAPQCNYDRIDAVNEMWPLIYNQWISIKVPEFVHFEAAYSFWYWLTWKPCIFCKFQQMSLNIHYLDSDFPFHVLCLVMLKYGCAICLSELKKDPSYTHGGNNVPLQYVIQVGLYMDDILNSFHQIQWKLPVWAHTTQN